MEARGDDGEGVHPETPEHDEEVEDGERLEEAVEHGAVTAEAVNTASCRLESEKWAFDCCQTELPFTDLVTELRGILLGRVGVGYPSDYFQILKIYTLSFA